MLGQGFDKLDEYTLRGIESETDKRTVSILLNVTVDCDWMLEGNDAGSINEFIGSIEYLARDFYRKPISAIRLQ